MHQTEKHPSLKKSNKQPKIKPLLQLNSHIDPHTVIVDDFSTPLPPIDRSSRQKQRNDEKRKYNIPKFMEQNEGNYKRKFMVINAYIKMEISHISNLTENLKFWNEKKK